jgi:hypothetical protein
LEGEAVRLLPTTAAALVVALALGQLAAWALGSLGAVP